MANAIEVLRVAGLSSYENRTISSGVLLFEGDTDPVRSHMAADGHGYRYSPALTGIKSFYRLCDGLQTLFLVNRSGEVLDIVEVSRYATPAQRAALEPGRRRRPHYRGHRGGPVRAVLKVSEDGLITFYDRQERIWDI